jgi:undecaprenyl-diphosphatase
VAGLAQLVVVVVLSGAHIAPLGAAVHGHLFQAFAAWPQPAGVGALAMSLGLLVAVKTYFWRDLLDMAVGVVRASKGKRDPGARLAGQLFAATLPVAGVVVALPFLEFRHLEVTPVMIGATAVAGGILLFLLDRMSMTIKRLEHASYLDMILVAVTQLIAFLLPGVSRSAVTMTCARLLGYERRDAARLSLLLGIPALGGLCVLQITMLMRDNALVWQPWLLGIGATAFFAGLISLALMMAWLKRHTFAPFALYRILIGALILALVWKP